MHDSLTVQVGKKFCSIPFLLYTMSYIPRCAFEELVSGLLIISTTGQNQTTFLLLSMIKGNMKKKKKNGNKLRNNISPHPPST